MNLQWIVLVLEISMVHSVVVVWKKHIIVALLKSKPTQVVEMAHEAWHKAWVFTVAGWVVPPTTFMPLKHTGTESLNQIQMAGGSLMAQ